MGRLRRVLTAVSVLMCHVYPIALLLVIVVVRFGASQSTLLSAALFLPPHGYLLPLLFLIPVALLRGPWSAWLSAGLGALLTLLGPMGLKLNLGGSSTSARIVVTMNVDSAYAGATRVVERILAQQPDIVFLQEIGIQGEELTRGLRTKLPFVVAHDQFIVASRFEISDLVTPKPAFVRGRDRTPRYIRVQINLPEGPFVAYNVHPISPRPAFIIARTGGFRSQIASGHLFSEEMRDIIWKNIEIRQFELTSAARDAAKEQLPVLIAGDLNTPANSLFFSRNFAFLRDSFAEAGLGFGYTFPAKLPFLRLDRVLIGDGIEALDARVDCRGLSDHFCLVTKLDFSRQ
jgi:vancomycin resistance protein VanJ